MDSDLNPSLLWQQIEHLLKNKLQGVLGGGFLLESGLKSEDLKTIGRGWKMVSKNQTEIMRCINHLSLLGQHSRSKPEKCDLFEQVQLAIGEFENLPDGTEFQCEVEYHPSNLPWLGWAEPQLVRSAIFGLLRIISEAMCDSNNETKIIISQRPNGIELTCLESLRDWDSIFQPDSSMDHRLRQSLLIEWGVAEFALKCQGGKLLSGTDGGKVWCTIELPPVKVELLA